MSDKSEYATTLELASTSNMYMKPVPNLNLFDILAIWRELISTYPELRPLEIAKLLVNK
jgi:hypothetical protein